MKHLILALILTATTALAVDAPSGQPIDLQEVLIDDVGGEAWLRFRFIAPQIARETGSIDIDTAIPDMKHLCTAFALPYLDEYSLSAQMIIISFADRPTEFGETDPDATQFFEAFRVENGTCIWEML